MHGEMVVKPRYWLVLVAIVFSFGVDAFAGVDFSEAAARRFSSDQLGFFERFVASKQDVKGELEKSLISSLYSARSNNARPPVNYSGLATNVEVSAALLMDYAEALYAAEQYELARDALGLMLPNVRQVVNERYGVLKLRLGLRGIEKLDPVTPVISHETEDLLNVVLAQIRLGDRVGAMNNLNKIADDARHPVEIRHRAILWLVSLVGEAGAKDPVLKLLDRLDGASPVLSEAMLSSLRLFTDIQPTAASAIELYLGTVAPDSFARMEAKDYLIKALISSGASFQAGEYSLATILNLSKRIGQLNQQIAEIKRMPLNALEPLVEGLAEGPRMRASELVRRERRLRKATEVLRAWRPYLDQYQTRLQGNFERFSAEIRDYAQAHKDALAKDMTDPAAQENFYRLELSETLGIPSNRDAIFKTFFGIALWEFGAEYPETWRPQHDAGKPATTRRRRQRDSADSALKAADQQNLPKALEHIKKISELIRSRVKKQPSIVFVEMADRATALAQKNEAQIDALEKLFPQITEAVQAEIVAALNGQKLVAQQWVNRFSGYAVGVFGQQKSNSAQPYFDLEKKIVPGAERSWVKDLQALATPAATRKVGEFQALPIFEPLKALAIEGLTPRIKVDALRQSARLATMLYETQKIPSPVDAVNNYQVMLKDYPELTDVAETVYQLARVQDLDQRPTESLSTLITFSKRFPADQRINEVLFRIAEGQFSTGDFPAASATYGKAIAGADPRFRDQAEYKNAWSYFKMGEYPQAIPMFLAIVDRIGAGASASDSRQQERYNDAFRAVALTFAYMNGPIDVEQYFDRVGARSYLSDIYFTLARYYLEHDRINDAANAYDFLVRKFPNDARAPSLLAAVYDGARKENLSKLALTLQERFAADYAVSGVYWAQASEAVRADINLRMKPFLTELSQMYHADGQQSRNRDTYAIAIGYYTQYIKTFPSDAQTPHMLFLLADAKFEIDDFAAARSDYEQSAYQYGAHPDAPSAGYAALVASQKLAEQAAEPVAQKARLRELVLGSGRFATAFPGDLRVETVLVKAAEDMLMLGEPSEAVAYAQRLLARGPADAVRKRAMLVVSHGQFDSKDYAKAEAAYKELLADKNLPPSEVAGLRDRLALAVYRQGEAQRAAGDSASAITTFLRVASVAPGAASVPNAEIDASALLLQVKQWRRAIEVLERFQSIFPTHGLATDISTRLAYAYENDGRYLKAADILESLSLKENDDALARQMAWRSGELREKGERTDLAVATFERYLQRYPAPIERAMEVRKLLAELATKAANVATRDRWLSEIITVARASENLSPRSRFLAAEAAIAFGDQQAEYFQTLALKLPLDKSLAAKQKALEQSLGWYEESGRFGVLEMTTAATFKTAELYRQLAKDVIASERPDGLNQLELGQYNILLEEEAFPFEEKAAEVHAINHRRIGSGAYDVWIERSISALQKLVPAKYERLELSKAYFDYIPPPKPEKNTDGKPGPGGASAAPKNVITPPNQPVGSDATLRP